MFSLPPYCPICIQSIEQYVHAMLLNHNCDRTDFKMAKSKIIYISQLFTNWTYYIYVNSLSGVGFLQL